MPANLTPQFIKARAAFSQAKTPEEKLECLKEMMITIPKHKGTEKMQGDIKRRISEMKREQETQKRSKRGISYKIPKEGAGQLVILGAPNVGKSQLLTRLTRAHSEVAEYPYTTHQAVPGMMPFEDIQFQLVDTPPITKDFMHTWMCDVIRPADAGLLVLDLSSDDLLDHAETIRDRLAKVRIHLVPQKPAPKEEEELRLTPEVYLPTLVVCNKADLPGASDRFEMVRELYGKEFRAFSVSAKTGAGLDGFSRTVFDFVGVIRVYTKEPGQKADLAQPYVLPIGSTVFDAAAMVHKDFQDNLKYARIWGTGVHDGQAVKRDHVLHDKDVIELHI